MSRHLYMTAEQLARMPFPHNRTELVRGRLIVHEPAGGRHGRIAATIVIEIGIYLRLHPIGTVYAADTGFTIERKPDTVRAPDVAYIRADRVPADDGVAFAEIAPDLAVEVVSPGDRAGAVRTKVAQWLRAGTLLVWVVDPRRRSARVYRTDGHARLVAESDMIEGEDVLPGFRAPLARFLDG
jgi:Uma2 family endonuclease